MILSQPELHDVAADVKSVQAFWKDSLARRKMTPEADDRRVLAYVSENRWLADCPSCGAGISCWDQNPEACCLGCGRVFVVDWPADKAEAERLLEERAPSARHWLPLEPVANLEAENARYMSVEPRLQVVKEVPRVAFTVATTDHELLDDDVLRLAKTGYVIAHDAQAGAAEVELQKHSAKDAARIEKDLNGSM